MQTTIGAGKFKAKCLKLLDDVASQRGTLIITKHGKPVAKLVPIELEQKLFGALKESVVSAVDIVSHLDIEWDAAESAAPRPFVRSSWEDEQQHDSFDRFVDSGQLPVR